jgi:hypothetical protein
MSSEGKSKVTCAFKDCTNSGVPQDGYNFFVCDACFDEFERCLDREHLKRIKQRLQRHANN